MPRTPRRRIAEGIYRDRYSLTGSVKVGSGKTALTREQAFNLDDSIETIERWRERTRVELHEERPQAARGTLGKDIETYLTRAKKHPASWKSKRSELKAWAKLLGKKPRRSIQAKDIDHAIAIWRGADVALKTIVNRCRTLHHLYVTLANDKRARTPLDNIDVPKPPKRRPVGVAAPTIKKVEKQLRAGDPKTRARFMVMAATGIRPSQLARVTAGDVNMRRGVVLLEGGKGGEPIAHVLNGDMKGAWRAFVDAAAWGAFDSTKFARDVRAAGWPAGIRPYNAKHSVGIELAERGADARDIQAWFGHTDDATTKIYTGVPLSRMRRLSRTIEGRLGWASAPSRAPSAGGRQRSKEMKRGENSKVRRSA